MEILSFDLKGSHERLSWVHKRKTGLEFPAQLFEPLPWRGCAHPVFEALEEEPRGGQGAEVTLLRLPLSGNAHRSEGIFQCSNAQSRGIS